MRAPAGVAGSLPAELARIASVRRVDAAYARGQEVAALLGARGRGALAAKVGRCCRVVAAGLTCGAVRPEAPCGQRLLCPICAAAAALDRRRAYEGAILACMERGLWACHWTLTLRNDSDLGRAVAAHLDAWRGVLGALRRQRSDGRARTAFAALGGVYSLETTYSEDTGWHVHVHAVVIQSGRIGQAEVSEEWRERTAGSWVVWVRRLHDAREAVGEVLKYSVKLGDLDAWRLLEAYAVLKGKRLMGSWGCLRGCERPIVERQGERLWVGIARELNGWGLMRGRDD